MAALRCKDGCAASNQSMIKKKGLVLLLLLGLAWFTRAYQYRDRFLYAHDNDLASWIVKDIVVDRHLRLIGQLTTAPGVFIGPLFYYLLIPFYWLTSWDPIGTVAFSWVVGVAAVASLYVILNRLYGYPTGVFGGLIHAASFAMSQNEREVVPTTPVMLWSMWFYFAIHRLYQGSGKSLIGLGILLALTWHLNLALLLLSPVVVVGVVIKRRFLTKKDIVAGLAAFLLVSLPLVGFEVRHGWSQTRAVAGSVLKVGRVSEGEAVGKKLERTARYAAHNMHSIFGLAAPTGNRLYILPVVGFGLLVLGHLFWQDQRYAIPVLVSWSVLFLAFFTLHPINLSEYYLNGLNVLWEVAAALLLTWVFSRGRWGRLLVAVMLAGFVGYQLNLLFTSDVNRSGYVEKTRLVEFIRSDAARRSYPCIAISYITDPGYNFGYRYFFWRAGLKIKRPSLEVPVYTIVFPHSRVSRLDQTFGALGLVAPDYDRYSPAGMVTGCAGADANLTEPMFGFTN